MLKKLRQTKGFSQSQLAADSGVNLRMIQKYEQGVKNINHARVETLLKLCNSLECSLAELVDDLHLKMLIIKYESRSDK